MNRVFVIGVVLAILLLIDIYVYQAVSFVMRNFSSTSQQIVRYTYWFFTAATFAVILLYNFGDPDIWKGSTRSVVFTIIFINYFSKVFAALFLVVDDIIRLGRWIAGLFQSGGSSVSEGQTITRSEFLTKTALVAGTVPLLTMSYGIISGAHDYRIRRKTIYLPNLPSSFDGITVAQLSDIHSGSFFNKTAVKGGVEMLMAEKPDMVFFTGDLVNNETSEVKDYVPIFEKVKAPLGVFSTTGNHDYGDYRSWNSEQAKKQNFEDLKEAHRLMGYDLLMNENRYIEVDGEKIAVIGIENWGAGRFAKYGKLDEAMKGTNEAPVKLLLSHDPSHWDAQVRPNYPDVDIAFAGHTHGFQFGVEWGDFKWSPAQYAYKQWAGLYQQDQQYLYVNRGYGYIGYPGRIGIPPEITLITLKKGINPPA
ncbi:metallophosphoesterase [Fulvivirga sedimenti]|uniref:Metallophosphoesterase n=1 Tax=Fulvivirga sedimenti TaxID=2879465 RepID=A0A9X1KZV3_9BACT|nr:metallophosphoesterase [Fulvivirga sedimenti]MCA6075415.1 metallophosphoesterase [Fulvivirga sedimenti]MCA6076592.1 metallophosphoesterase [Fulvivirga sedimenti]MCA6077720.1 metallophosphoesterase [Fulvivirga sedimenti]